MKVVIVSTPRTCSSYLCNIFEKKFDLIDYSELFSEIWLKTSPENKLRMVKRSDNFVMKLTSTSLLSLPHLFTMKTFPWETFDHIVITERLDLAQQVSSWLLLSHTQMIGKGETNSSAEYIRDGMKTPIELPLDEGQLENIIKITNHFHQEVKPYLLNSGLKSVKLVNHEMLQKTPDEYLEELREKTEIYWKLNDFKVISNYTNIDYTPYIEAHNLRQRIEDIQHKLKNPNATKEENNTTEQPVENEGIV